MANVIIAEGNDLLRKTYSELLVYLGITILGKVKNHIELLELLAIHNNCTVICDIDLISENISSSLHKMTTDFPNAKILLCGFNNFQQLADGLISGGASGYYDKTIADIEKLADSIKRVSNGEKVIVLRNRIK